MQWRRHSCLPSRRSCRGLTSNGEDSSRRRDESRRGTQECVRHENRRGARRYSGLVVQPQSLASRFLGIAAQKTQSQENPPQAQFAAFRLIPFRHSMGAAALASRTDRHRRKA